MAHNLKLEIFRISLKKRGGSNKDLLSFKEFFKTSYPLVDKNESYKSFINDFINSFDQKFHLNKDKTKGISASKNLKLNIKSENNSIDFELFGGPTGISQKLFKQNNAGSQKGEVDNDDVSTLPYYIKLWTPYNHDTGVLMVQSYSNHTITDMVKMELSRLFHKTNFSLLIIPHFPKDVKSSYLNRSVVYKMALVKESIDKSKRKLLNPLFTEFENLKIKIEITGFQENVNVFWDKMFGVKKTISSNLEDFNIYENDDYEIVAYYKDSNGYKSNTSLKKEFDIKPTIFLDDLIKDSNNQYYDFDKITNHTNDLLETIKKEINYKNA